MTLYLPGLNHSFNLPADELDQLRAPALKKFLSRSYYKEQQLVPAYHWLYHRFVSDHNNAQSIPVAALSAALDGLDGKQGYWMRADPVYLYPDTHSLILQDPANIQLTKSECEALVSVLSPLFDDTDYELYTPDPSRWYFHFKTQAPDLTCTTIYEAMHKPANKLLPQGNDRRRWHTLFNEIQMVLSQAEVNQQREQQGKSPVNSLWFWGEGKYPIALEGQSQTYIGNNELLEVLCQLTGTPIKKADTISLDAIEPGKDYIMVDLRLYEADSRALTNDWLITLENIDRDILSPLLNQLANKKLNLINIDTRSRRYTLPVSRLKAFWKPVRPLSRLLS